MKNRVYNYYHHFLFWGLYYLTMFFMYISIFNFEFALLKSSINIVFQLLIFYINLNYLIPVYFGKRTRFVIINFILTLLFSITIEQIDQYVFKNVIDVEKNQHFFKYNIYGIKHLFDNSIAVLVSIAFYQNMMIKLKDKQISEVKNAELDLLKSQINPHFLFNSLNNIYSVSIYEKAIKTSESILKLSNLLDFSLYYTNQERISISREIEYIKNLVEIFKLKDSSIIDKIKFKFEKLDEKIKISPMLLAPFVENSLKHSNVLSSKLSKIIINITSRNNYIFFLCENTYDKKYISKDKTKGVGINNVKRRLKIIYPNSHRLKIYNKKGLFKVYLKIFVNEK